MKNELAKILSVAAATFLMACGADTGTSPGPGDGDESNDVPSTVVSRASLEAAVPANGDLVRGDFLLGAIVDSEALVEVKFLVDGVVVGVTNEHPYQLQMSVCDLSEGNHAYIVSIEDSAGNRDYVEQFFESEPCAK